MDRGWKKHPMTQDDKARIMSTQAKKIGREPKNASFPARTQSAVTIKNEPPQQK